MQQFRSVSSCAQLVTWKPSRCKVFLVLLFYLSLMASVKQQWKLGLLRILLLALLVSQASLLFEQALARALEADRKLLTATDEVTIYIASKETKVATTKDTKMDTNYGGGGGYSHGGGGWGHGGGGYGHGSSGYGHGGSGYGHGGSGYGHGGSGYGHGGGGYGHGGNGYGHGGSGWEHRDGKAP